MVTKQELRKMILQNRDSLTPEQRREKSRRIINRLLCCEEYMKADEYLLFSSFRSEVDTFDLLRQALLTPKPVYLPKVIGKEMKFYQIESLEELESGYQGILEPKEDKSIEFIPGQEKKIFILVPGAAFDREGGRIGYGGGFYDRFLKSLEKEILPKNLCKMAVAFECQVIENGKIVKEVYDISPDYIITEKRSIKVRQISQ